MSLELKYHKKISQNFLCLLQGRSMHQLMDLFAVPEMTLFSHVIEYFEQNNILYDPDVVFNDVRVG